MKLICDECLKVDDFYAGFCDNCSRFSRNNRKEEEEVYQELNDNNKKTHDKRRLNIMYVYLGMAKYFRDREYGDEIPKIPVLEKIGEDEYNRRNRIK